MRATRLPALLLKALRVDANSVAQVPLTVEGVTGQTSNLAELKDSDGVAVALPSRLNAAFGHSVLRVARAKYSFAVDGGVVSTLTPATTALIPDNAIIIGGTINSTTACTSGGAATVAIGTSAGSSTTSLLGATAVASLSADARINSVATFAAPVKMTAAGYLNVTIAAFNLTAGIIEITVLYFVAAA